MKVIFAHDHIFLNYHEKYYSQGGLPLDALVQYRDVFGKLTILSRQTKTSENSGLVLSSGSGINFVEIPNFKSIKNYYKKKSAMKIVEEEIYHTDFVIARLPSSIGELSIKYAKKYNKPYLVELVGCPFDALYHHSFIGKIIAPFSKYKIKKIMLDTDYSIYVTEKYLQKKYPTKGKNINCSNVVLKDISEENLENRLNRINGHNMMDFKIGTIGSLDVRYKGQSYIIDTLTKHDKNNHYTYEMVGPNISNKLEKIELDDKEKNRIKSLGVLDKNEVYRWLDEIDIYIQPSETEGLPRSVIEAMSRGLLVIGSSVGGIPELIDAKYIIENLSDSQKIYNLLSGLIKDDFINSAKVNFKMASFFSYDSIKEKRRNFLSDFKNENNPT